MKECQLEDKTVQQKKKQVDYIGITLSSLTLESTVECVCGGMGRWWGVSDFFPLNVRVRQGCFFGSIAFQYLRGWILGTVQSYRPESLWSVCRQYYGHFFFSDNAVILAE